MKPFQKKNIVLQPNNAQSNPEQQYYTINNLQQHYYLINVLNKSLQENTQLLNEIKKMTQHNREILKKQNQELEILLNKQQVCEAKNDSNNQNLISSIDLIEFLYIKNFHFKYELVQLSDRKVQLVQYRQRNFRIEIGLVDQNGSIVKNPNKLRVSIHLFTNENPPKFITKNTQGNTIFKNQPEQYLIDGYSRFQKIQINQVSSHYPSRKVFLLVCPLKTQNQQDFSENYIHYSQIKPLVIENLQIKAKKIKNIKEQDQDQAGSNDS